MTYVVDSSVAIKWFTPELLYERADQLLKGTESLVAPSLLLVEVANALWRKARLGEVSTAQVDDAIEELQSVIVLRPIDAALTIAAFQIAQRIGHSIYDCIFLACTVAENVQFVTADTKFHQKVAGDELSARVILL